MINTSQPDINASIPIRDLQRVTMVEGQKLQIRVLDTNNNEIIISETDFIPQGKTAAIHTILTGAVIAQ